MAESQDDGMSVLIDSFDEFYTNNTNDQIANYEGLVKKEFERIYDAYLALWEQIDSYDEPMVIFNEIERRAEILHDLQSITLPKFRVQVNCVSKVLLLRQSNPQLVIRNMELLLQVLKTLEISLRDLRFAIGRIAPDLRAISISTDQDFKGLKLFKTSRIAVQVCGTTELACKLLRTSSGFIQTSGYQFNRDPKKRLELESISSACSKSVDETLFWINRSELSIFQAEWEKNVNTISDLLGVYMVFINPPRPEEEEGDRRSAPGRLASIPTPLRPVNDTSETPEQAQSDRRRAMILIIKLSRLFVNKLIKISNDKTNLRFTSTLSSRELEQLVVTTREISRDVDNLVNALLHEEVDAYIQEHTPQLLKRPAHISHLLPSFFHPLHPYQPSPKIHLKSWFSHWNQLYHLAVEDLYKTVEQPTF